MNKVEMTYSELIGNTSISNKQKVTMFISEVKALIKIGIVNSNLITTIAGFLLAISFTSSSFISNWGTFLLTIIGSALVIAGGCIVNNWYDVDIDPKMSRTKNRPTVTGFFSLKTVLTIGLVTTAIGLGLLMFTTWYATLFAFIGWFGYVVLYTMWSKRRYTLNTVIGSLSGAMPPLIGWAAISPSFHVVPFVMFLIMFIWQTPHFLALAMKKRDEYEAAGIPMLPVVRGMAVTKRQIIVYIACLLPLPFFLLPTMGITFAVIATLLNLGWLAIAFTGLFVDEDKKWANTIFIFSLNYLIILFPLMIIVKLPIFN
ncbi:MULTISPECIES: heme o synthase [Oceanobacillus]|uniref:Protoheme IX farnesyltransferase n=1 Tax=Oceanobacillus kimchii TaxID=746691 RepID=A0ABQ5TG65_9BACI|nr:MULTISPECIES: heme o synthase [Oceanobacillus]MBT2598830.1 heme o synthase [Oceanobacillus sp. ISL-74]MBT2651749.1 heme o synthase [Oceanobacillus sp. ISL-73]MCT1576398.1 heme o synthase [Oceanobacillus kimchii]MCT2136034.1 heme o synthase [Oceanobacillus kimchii]OEH54544.1 protoheme IX farnesyltransferase [Oceanobacillus sp. E9]